MGAGRFERDREVLGFGGHSRVRGSHVLVVGAGGLGVPVLLYLAAVGVGCVSIVDGDVVEASNLSRQLLYGEGDLSRMKAEVAAERLRAQFRDVSVCWYGEEFTAESAGGFICDGVDLVVDACDDEASRIVIGDAAFSRGAGVDLVTAGISGWHGQVAHLRKGVSGCYRCAFGVGGVGGVGGAGGAGGARAGSVLGAFAGLVGSLAAVIAVRALAMQREESVESVGRVILVDGVTFTVEELRAGVNPSCGVCGTGE